MAGAVRVGERIVALGAAAVLLAALGWRADLAGMAAGFALFALGSIVAGTRPAGPAPVERDSTGPTDDDGGVR